MVTLWIFFEHKIWRLGVIGILTIRSTSLGSCVTFPYSLGCELVLIRALFRIIYFFSLQGVLQSFSSWLLAKLAGKIPPLVLRAKPSLPKRLSGMVSTKNLAIAYI